MNIKKITIQSAILALALLVVSCSNSSDDKTYKQLPISIKVQYHASAPAHLAGKTIEYQLDYNSQNQLTSVSEVREEYTRKTPIQYNRRGEVSRVDDKPYKYDAATNILTIDFEGRTIYAKHIDNEGYPISMEQEIDISRTLVLGRYEYLNNRDLDFTDFVYHVPTGDGKYMEVDRNQNLVFVNKEYINPYKEIVAPRWLFEELPLPMMPFLMGESALKMQIAEYYEFEPDANGAMMSEKTMEEISEYEVVEHKNHYPSKINVNFETRMQGRVTKQYSSTYLIEYKNLTDN